MKKIKWIAVVTALCLFGEIQGAWAEAGWDNGFYIKSEDGQFKMNVGGRLQTLWSMQKRSGRQKTAGARATQAADNFSNTFSLRRARLQTSGTIFEKLEWVTMLTISTAGTSTATNFDTSWYAWFTYNFADYFKLTGGFIQLPMDRMSENSTAWLFGVEPPLTATQEDGVKELTIARDSLSLGSDLGIRFDGDVGRFSYALGVGNGNGFRTVNANNEFSYSARGTVDVLEKAPYTEPDFERSEKPKLTIGFGTGFEDEDAADENVAGLTRLWSWTSSGDIAFRYLGFSLNSEFYYRMIKTNAVSVEDTNRNRKLSDIGYYGNAGYFVLPQKLEVIVTASQIFREGPDNNANEFGGGLNWYILGKNKAKLQFDYTNVLDYDDIPGLNNATYHRFRLMFSMFI